MSATATWTATHRSTGEHDGLFETGPPRRLPRLMGLSEPLLPNTTSRVAATLLIGWAPLALLSGLQALQGHAGALASFVEDVGVHARLAIAAPLLVAAYTTCARRLGAIALNFLSSGVLESASEEPFRAAIARSRARLRSVKAEIAVLILAYAVVGAIYFLGPAVLTQNAWQELGRSGEMSPAGWWHTLVSVPLLLVILLGWVWRLLIWSHFLRNVAALDLRLVPAHPDRAGGLGFLTESVRALSMVALAFGALPAGRFATVHIHDIASPLTTPFLIGFTLLLALLIGVAPLTTFTPKLMQTWRRGLVEYGGLASTLGRQFESKWLTSQKPPEMLEQPDFSAATDLYQVVGNVHAMRMVPVDRGSLLLLLAASVVLFVPAMFFSMPAEDVLRELKGLIS
jgi:hypothetical protein